MKLSQRDKELFEKFEKNKSKLSVTGGEDNPWFWRIGELPYAHYQKLGKDDKQSHLNYLLKLPPKNRSTNDEYILKFYGPKDVQEQLHFFSLDDNFKELMDANMFEEINNSSTEGQEDTGDQSVQMGDVSVDELISYGKEYLLEYLNEYFKIEHQGWESDFKFQTLDRFVTNCNNFMLIDELTLLHLSALKQIYFK